MVKKIFKYGTGMTVPVDSVYLHTRIERIEKRDPGYLLVGYRELVWHYFLVEVKE